MLFVNKEDVALFFGCQSFQDNSIDYYFYRNLIEYQKIKYKSKFKAMLFRDFKDESSWLKFVRSLFVIFLQLNFQQLSGVYLSKILPRKV